MANLEGVKKQATSHLQGFKQVFIKNEDTPYALTQFAFGNMSAGEKTDFHQHATMDEYFYFIKGKATYTIGEDELIITPSTFVRIPGGTPHKLENTGDGDLEFVYFGIDTSR